MIIPREWRECLFEIQKDFPNAVIAGGCLRDCYFKREIKDVDIFIPEVDNAALEKFLVNKYNVSITRNIQAKKYDNVKNPEVDQVITVANAAGKYPVDFIAVDVNKERVLARFDYDICQLSYDLNNFIMTDEFKNCTKTKTIHLIRCDDADQWKRSTGARLDKLRGKYPEFAVDLGLYQNIYDPFKHVLSRGIAF